MDNSYAIPGSAPVVQASVESRATFILKTYAHLFGAIAGAVVARMMQRKASES